MDFEATVVVETNYPSTIREVRALLTRAGYEVDEERSAKAHLLLKRRLTEDEASALRGFLGGLASVVLTRTPLPRRNRGELRRIHV